MDGHDRNSANLQKGPKNPPGRFSSAESIGEHRINDLSFNFPAISANEEGDATRPAEDFRFKGRVNTLKRAKHEQGPYGIRSFDISPLIDQIPSVVKQAISTEFRESGDRNKELHLAINRIEQKMETSLKALADHFEDRLKDLVEQKTTQSHTPATPSYAQMASQP